MNTMTLRASQTEIAFEDAGTGPVVVLLHGFPLDSGMWRLQVQALGERNRIIAPDLPGFGGSAPSAGLTMDSIADIVAELLDHLGVNERVVVGGLSMGGYAALAFARLYPQRLGALILADTKADPDDEAARAKRDKMIQLVEIQGVPEIVEQLLPQMVGADTMAGQPDIVTTVRQMAQKQSADGVAAALHALRDRPDATPGLAHISVPTLVIVGEQDTLTPPEIARSMTTLIPNARLVTIPHAGHLSNLENPDAFNAAIRDFLDQLPANGTPSRTV